MAVSGAALFLGTAAAFAAPAPQGGASPGLEEVIVTAQRRAGNLQDVPLSITTLTGTQLDVAGVESTLDLQYRTPGFVFKTNSVLGQPYIRGVGSDLLTGGADPAVATFVDGVYMARAYAALQDFYDVDRVEILKGPQGTLYGRNATAGAIHVISNVPADEFDAAADVSYGNYDKIRVRGLVNVPVVGDRVLFRVSGLVHDRDGFSRNIFLHERVDDEDYGALRSQLRLVATDDLAILLRADYSKEHSSRAAAPHLDPDSGINLALLPPFSGTSPEDPRQVTHDFSNIQDVKAWGFSARIDWDLDWATVTSLTARRETEAEIGLDLDATEIPLVVNQPRGNSRVVTQELQLTSKSDGALEWIAGAYYLDEDAFEELNIGFPLFGALNQPRGRIDTTAWALFGEASWRLNHRLRATAGIRYSDEKKREDFTQTFSDPFGVVTGIPGGFAVAAVDERHWDAVTPKFGLAYSFSDAAMVYFTVTRGFKAGGYNTNQLQPAFDPEFILSREIGLKSLLAGGKVRLNLAAFYYDYTDIQLLTIPDRSPPGTFPIVINVPRARVRGLEADLLAEPAGGLQIDAGISLLDAEFREFRALDPNNPQLGEVDRKGARMPQAPELSLNVAAQYTWPLREVGELTLRADYRYQSAMFFNTFQDPVVRQDGYSLLGARLSFETLSRRWYGALFASNLLDELYAQTMIRQDPIIGNVRFWGAPRTYGIQIGVRY